MIKKIILASLVTLSLSSCNNNQTNVINVDTPVKDSVVVKFTNYSSIFIDYYSESTALNCIATKDTLFIKIPYNSKIGYLINSNYYETVGTKDTVIVN